jgi:aryl-alcohol dehydrogenase-like predicted oxidoreductase
MQYRLLGRTGVYVSPICIGAMNFGSPESGAPTNEADTAAILHAAFDVGINFVDTSNSYNAGSSEIVVGKALAGRRDRIILATKAFFKTGADINDQGGSRRHLIKACEDSLRRLNTDYIDLYQMHRPSPHIPIDETLNALTDLVRAGKVRYVGCTTHPAWMVMEALAVSERMNVVRFVSEQPPYNLLDRRIENELVPLAQRYNLALLPWSPLAQGLLAGRYKLKESYATDSRGARLPNSIYADRITHSGIAAGEQFTMLAKQFGKTPGQLGLLWCKDQPGITAPIYGPRTLAQLQEILPVLEMNLTPEELAACDGINSPGSVIVNFHNTAAWMKMKVGQ